MATPLGERVVTPPLRVRILGNIIRGRVGIVFPTEFGPAALIAIRLSLLPPDMWTPPQNLSLKFRGRRAMEEGDFAVELPVVMPQAGVFSVSRFPGA